jgi:hypothetical protein
MAKKPQRQYPKRISSGVCEKIFVRLGGKSDGGGFLGEMKVCGITKNNAISITR